MAYRVLMELMPRPDSIEEWVWNGTGSSKISSTGGKAWTAKLNSGDTIWEFSTQSEAEIKLSSLFADDSTNRRYKVIEV